MLAEFVKLSRQEIELNIYCGYKFAILVGVIEIIVYMDMQRLINQLRAGYVTNVVLPSRLF